MNRLPIIFLIFLFIFAFTGCGGSSLSPSEFKKHIENKENGFVKQINVSPFTLSCMYMPSEYLTVNYFRSNNIIEDEFVQKKSEYVDFSMFRIEISADDPRSFYGLEEYLNFYMQEDIVQVCGEDVYPCIVYHAEPFNSIKNKQLIEVGFTAFPCREFEIVLSKTPFSNENLAFVFNTSELPLPSIKLN